MKQHIKKTIEYYDKNALDYSSKVNGADLKSSYDRFLRFVPDGGTIYDIGCGSGRDLKYFSENGYKAYGIDLSPELCKEASKHSGCSVICADALLWETEEQVDGIWASASLLHLKEDEIVSFISKKQVYLKENGIICFSMKSGISEGYDQKGRYFTPFSELLLKKILHESRLVVLDRWKSMDSLDRKDIIWESIVLGHNHP